MRCTIIGLVIVAVLSAGPAVGQVGAPSAAPDAPTSQPAACTQAQATAAQEGDARLGEAAKFVKASERYMHHDELVRGMKGYGQTVMSGTDIVTFDVEIVSVMHKWGPHQDVILAKLSGLGLEKSGIIAGMSGSPVYMPDKNGKFRMVGAVAYGWSYQNEPLCGIQPITQMLAVGKGAVVNSAGAPKVQPDTQPAEVAGGQAISVRSAAPESYLRCVLSPDKLDFGSLAGGARQADAAADEASQGPQLRALSTPMMVGGLSRRTIAMMGKELGGRGMLPMQSGGVGKAQADAIKDDGRKFKPGSAIHVTLVRGDADMTGVGTVTEVIDGRVFAFGHSMLGQGKLELPMGPAYIHTIVSSSYTSFKLGSGLECTGALDTDEEVAIAGNEGAKARMIPMTVRVDWPADGRSQSFSYELCQHNSLTPALVRYLMNDAAMGWHELPEHHTVGYFVKVDFKGVGTYWSNSVASGRDIAPAISDATRPIFAMLNNPLGAPAAVEKIDIRLTVQPGDQRAQVLDLRLDGQTYKAGETVTGKLLVQPWRKERRQIAVSFKLPADIKPGKYQLDACDAYSATAAEQSLMPHRYEPRTTAQLFEALGDVVSRRGDVLYLRLALPEGGLAIDSSELPELPPSRAVVLAEAAAGKVQPFRKCVEQIQPSEYVLEGSASASFTITEDEQLRTLE